MRPLDDPTIMLFSVAYQKGNLYNQGLYLVVGEGLSSASRITFLHW